MSRGAGQLLQAPRRRALSRAPYVPPPAAPPVEVVAGSAARGGAPHPTPHSLLGEGLLSTARVLALFAGGAGIAGGAFQFVQTAHDESTVLSTPVPPSGRFVEVPGVGRMHCLVVAGPGGGPVVVLEAGPAGTCLDWLSVVRELPPSCTVVAYDRAGLGLSAAAADADAPRTCGVMAGELDALLRALGLAAQPVVLVGFSSGSLVSQAFARLFPERTAGLVLVDGIDGTLRQRHSALHPSVASAIQDDTRNSELMVWLARFGVLRLIAMNAQFRAEAAQRAAQTAAVEAAVAAGASPSPSPSAPAVAGGAPAERPTREVQARLLATSVRTVHRKGAAAEAAAHSGSELELAALQSKPLPEGLPLVCLTHDASAKPYVVVAHNHPDIPPEVIEQMDGVWFEVQRSLAAISSRSLLLQPKSAGLFLLAENPRLVAAAIQTVLEDVGREGRETPRRSGQRPPIAPCIRLRQLLSDS